MDIETAEATATPLEKTVTVGATDEKRAGKALLWKAAQLGSSRLLNLITSLVLGRLLTPVDFGIVAIASVAVTTMMTATETGMTNALVQATDRQREHYDRGPGQSVQTPFQPYHLLQ